MDIKPVGLSPRSTQQGPLPNYKTLGKLAREENLLHLLVRSDSPPRNPPRMSPDPASIRTTQREQSVSVRNLRHHRRGLCGLGEGSTPLTRAGRNSIREKLPTTFVESGRKQPTESELKLPLIRPTKKLPEPASRSPTA